MRRTLLVLMAACGLLVVSPVAALARKHHHRQHHARVRHESFKGSDPSGSGPAAPAGTVTSFSNGTLVIMMANGTAVSGTVTSDTEIECEAMQSTTTSTTPHED